MNLANIEDVSRVYHEPEKEARHVEGKHPSEVAFPFLPTTHTFYAIVAFDSRLEAVDIIRAITASLITTLEAAA